jgi:hypothetical protein
MPAVKTGEVVVLFVRDGIAVEGAMVRVFELDVREALIGFYETVADDLDLWLMRDGLEIWVEDATLRVEGFAVAIL